MAFNFNGLAYRRGYRRGGAGQIGHCAAPVTPERGVTKSNFAGPAAKCRFLPAIHHCPPSGPRRPVGLWILRRASHNNPQNILRARTHPAQTHDATTLPFQQRSLHNPLASKEKNGGPTEQSRNQPPFAKAPQGTPSANLRFRLACHPKPVRATGGGRGWD